MLLIDFSLTYIKCGQWKGNVCQCQNHEKGKWIQDCCFLSGQRYFAKKLPCVLEAACSWIMCLLLCCVFLTLAQKNEAWDTGRESARLSNVFQWEPICFQSLKQGFFSLHRSLSLIQLPIFNFAWNQNWNYSTNIQWTLTLCQVLIQALGSQRVSPVSLISGVCHPALQDQGSTINTSRAPGE